MLANQDDKGSLQKMHWRSSTSCRKVRWFDDSRSQSSQWGLWISKQLPIRSRGRSREKLKLLRRRKRVWESFSSRRKNRKSFTLTIHWNLANLVKIYHGFIELQHLIDPRWMALLKEPYAEWKKEHQLYCCNQAWMKNGGLILWNAAAVCDMSKTSWQMWKLLMKGDSEKHLEVQ